MNCQTHLCVHELSNTPMYVLVFFFLQGIIGHLIYDLRAILHDEVIYHIYHFQ